MNLLITNTQFNVMVKIFIIFFSIIFHTQGMACTIIPKTFCKSLELRPNYLVLMGKIITIDNTGIDLEVIEIIKGNESRTTIRIWDGTDFECNGIWSMAAADIGALNDSVIIMLPKIREKQNEWDVIGDYRRPDPYYYTSQLKIRQGEALGLIKGDALAPPEYNILSLNYNELRDNIVRDGDCSSIILDIDNPKFTSKLRVNNPFTSTLSIQLNDDKTSGIIKLYSQNGQIVSIEKFRDRNKIDIESSTLQSGVYFLEIRIKNRIPELKKVIKL